ncbi:hypothetical protein PHYSODRAFT_419921, partial [Phytophthora sojae]
VKDLHYKAASHLCHNTDVILLPKFSTSFILEAKWEVAGKAMVLCCEMYSSRTCDRCCRLHLTLRNEDVFTAAS